MRSILLPIVTLAATAAAQSFQYPSFASTSGLTLLGTTAQVSGAMRLTTVNGLNQTGLFWHNNRLPVASGFDTTFTFRITTPSATARAEGMAFIIQDDPLGTAAIGGSVWGIGYGVNGSTGIRNSIAVELDTYQDTTLLGDTSANELTIHTRGSLGNNENEQYSIGRNTPSVLLSNGQVHTIRVVYVPGSLDVYVDNAATPAIHAAYDLAAGGRYLNNAVAPGLSLSTGTVLAGFSATTGGANSLTETVEILSWSWTSTPLTDPCFAGTFANNTLTIDGSAGNYLRRVPLFAGQPFRVEMASPTGSPAGMPFVLLATPLPSPGALGTALPFGSMCFPVLPIAPPVFAIADSFGVVPALLPASTTPWLLQVPPSLLLQPLELTLQAVVASNLNPFSLGISNAITVAITQAPAPVITSVSPLSAAPGARITVTGTGFVPGCTVELNGSPVTPVAVTTTAINIDYPAGLPCSSQVAVRNPDGRAAAAAINPVPTVTSTVLGSGPAAGNATFVVQGNGFAVGTTATIGGAAATISSISATSIVMRTPPGTPGVAQVVLTTPGGCQATTTYTYQ
jgi:Legume lectin domain/IPT/TIG domain